MKDLIKTFDELPWILKIVLALPILDIVWTIYRLCRSLDKNNVVGIVLAVLTFIPAAPIYWIFDIVYILVYKKIWWLD